MNFSFHGFRQTGNRRSLAIIYTRPTKLPDTLFGGSVPGIVCQSIRCLSRVSPPGEGDTFAHDLAVSQFLNRQVLRPGTWDFLLDSVSCVVGWMIFGNFCIRSTRSFKDKLIWRLGRGTKWGTQNRVKYAWYQKNKGTLLSQLFMKFDKMQSFFNFVHVLGSFEANQIMAV